MTARHIASTNTHIPNTLLLNMIYIIHKEKQPSCLLHKAIILTFIDYYSCHCCYYCYC